MVKKENKKEKDEESKKKAEEKKFSKAATLLLSEKIESKVPEGIRDLYLYYKRLNDTEEAISRSIVPWVSETDIYKSYLKHIQGIGPILAANLIAMLNPVENFPKPSMLVAYAGLSGSHYQQECEEGHKFLTSSPKPSCPVNLTETDGDDEEIKKCGAKVIDSTFVNMPMKRQRGYHIFQNARLKTTLFKIATSFEKQPSDKSQYRMLYDIKKAEYASRENLKDEKGGKGHVRMMTMRYVEKRFLTNLHVVWSLGMGIDVTPYEATLKNHTIDPIRTDDNFPLPKKGSFAPISEQRMWSIRQLTDNYYDMQKMRIKTFNNVIAWIKSNPDKAKDYLKSSDKEEDSGKEE